MGSVHPERGLLGRLIADFVVGVVGCTEPTWEQGYFPRDLGSPALELLAWRKASSCRWGRPCDPATSWEGTVTLCHPSIRGEPGPVPPWRARCQGDVTGTPIPI